MLAQIASRLDWIKPAKQYIILLVLFAILQFSLPLIAEPNHSFKNLSWYYSITQQINNVGLFGLWTPYPPLFSLLLYFYGKIVSDQESFFLFWQMMNIAMVFAIGAIIYKIVARYNTETALVAAFGYLLLNATFNSAITIGYYFDQYDYIPILMMMASLYLLMSDRPIESAFLCGIGTMTKLFPVLILPVAVFTLGNRKGAWYLLFFLLACAISVLPWLIVNPDSQRSFLKFTTSRDAWETVWNFPRMTFPPIPVIKSFLVPFDSDANPYPWLTWLTAISAVVCLGWHRRSKSNGATARIVLSLLLILIIFSKGVSSYYIEWLFPLFFLIYKPVYAFAACAVLMLVGSIEFIGGVPIQPTYYWIAIFTRHALFISLLILCLVDQPFSRINPLAPDSTPRSALAAAPRS